MNEEQQFQMRQAVAALEMGSMNYHNATGVQNFDTTQNMSGGMYAPGQDGPINFDPTMSYDDDMSVLNAMGRYLPRKGMEPKGQITYDLQVNYVAGAGGNPVNISLFQTLFNPGTFVGNDLQFTNATGDTATIVGITSPFRAIMGRSETELFRINFVRMAPVAAPQFNTSWRFDHTSVWGGGSFNQLTPKTFITPLQFQLLRVDIPLGYIIDPDRGWSFDVLPSEIAANGGLQMTLFIDKILNPTNEMKNKPAVQPLTGPGIMQQQASSADPIQNAVKLVQIENLRKAGLLKI